LRVNKILFYPDLPNCGHQKTEEMPTDGCPFFMNVKTAKPCCDQNPAITALDKQKLFG
jgi:hypothetical protein